MRLLVAITALLTLFTLRTSAEEIDLLAWNLESGNSDPEVIAEQLAEFSGYELIGLSEVQANAASDFVVAAITDEGAAFDHLLGNTGANDRLLLIWNADRFEKLEELEMFELAMQGGRAPLAVKLKEHASGHTFWFMVNHLYRGNTEKRNRQAKGLREWCKGQSTPVIVTGDFNMDYDVPAGPGNDAFNIIREGNHVHWIEPAEKIRTQSSFNSILDFVFINDAATSWSLTSKIIQLPEEFVPVDEKSDHRPIAARIDVPPLPAPPRALIVERGEPTRRSTAQSNLRRGPIRVETDAYQGNRSIRGEQSASKDRVPARVDVSEQQSRASRQSTPRTFRDNFVRQQLELMKAQIELIESLLREDESRGTASSSDE